MSTLWRDVIQAQVAGATRDPQTGATVVPATALVSWLVMSGCAGSRAAAAELGEALRARDVIRPLSGECRFSDSGTRWVCRADEDPSPQTSFSVSALLNSSSFLLAAPFLKQGALFLNPRFFLLDRSTCRLYVFTHDYSTAPRYYVDFVAQACTVTLVDPSASTAAAASSSSSSAGAGAAAANGRWEGGDESNSDTEDDEDDELGPLAGGGRSAGSSSSSGLPPPLAPWLPRGTGSSSLPSGRARAWGFTLTGPSLRVVAYTPSERRARVWVSAIAAACARRAPRPIVSHSQQRLRRINIAPPLAVLPGFGGGGNGGMGGGGGGGAGGAASAQDSAPESSSLFGPYGESEAGGDGGGGGASASAAAAAGDGNVLASSGVWARDASSAPSTAAAVLGRMAGLRSQGGRTAVDGSADGADGLSSASGAAGGPGPAPVLLLRNVRDLLLISHDTLREVVGPHMVEGLAAALAEAGVASEEEDKAAGAGAASALLPSWAAVSDATLAASCPPGAMAELYARPLELYVRCLAESLGLAGDGPSAAGGEGGGGSSGYAGGGAAEDLRALRLLVLQPWRIARDLGIFIPSHQRYLLERCAVFVAPLPEEEEAVAAEVGTAGEDGTTGGSSGGGGSGDGSSAGFPPSDALRFASSSGTGEPRDDVDAEPLLPPSSSAPAASPLFRPSAAALARASSGVAMRIMTGGYVPGAAGLLGGDGSSGPPSLSPTLLGSPRGGPPL
jgi:hypothetical protein